MSGLIPDKTVDVLKTFNDLSVDLYGILCTLYIPNNLTSLDGNDMYTTPAEVTYRTYQNQSVWIEWHAKDLERLRKMGIFSEKDAPIVGYFKNFPEVTLRSYIKVPIRYIPGQYDTDEFEIVNVIMKSMYNAEVIRAFKLAPRRVK